MNKMKQDEAELQDTDGIELAGDAMSAMDIIISRRSPGLKRLEAEGERIKAPPFTRDIAISILRAEYAAIRTARMGINDETKAFIDYHFPGLEYSYVAMHE